MKSKLKLAIVLIFLTFNLSDLISSTTIPDTIIVSGKIFNTNLQINKVKITVNRVGIDNEVYYKELSDSGTFTIKFYNYYPSDIRIQYDKSNFLFLAHPGDFIQLEFDNNKNRKHVLHSVRFKGNGSEENIKVIKFQLIADSLWSLYDNAQTIASKLEHVAYKSYLDSLNKISLSLYEKFVESEKPNTEVKNWSFYFCQENYFTNLDCYPEWHAKSSEYKDWSTPNKFYEYQKEFLPIKKENFICTYVYRQLVEQCWGVIKYNIYLSNTEPNDSIKLYSILNSSYDQLIKQLLFARLINNRFKANNVSIYETYSVLITKVVTEPFLKIPLQKQYEQVKERIANPQFVSDAIIRNIKNTSVKSIFDSIVVLNKNKVVYIDCWAVWCSPCLKEFPSSEELQNKLKGKDVTFVYLCIDSEEDRWKAKISELKLKGNHYFLDKVQSLELRETLKIEGIPFYFLLNKQGSIAEKGGHLRASEPTTLKRITKLLNEK